ncbi:MAG: hypothetical protein M3174_00420 [Actinomycetota bacterium]|nr:hypothetical protein [Actinomycetota bacterium]
MDKKLLGIYINDHLAGHVAGIELAKRSAGSNEGTPLGEFLEGFVAELQEEQQVMESALDAVDRDPSRLKTFGAWVAEKAGRFKLNGNVLAYSPLSRLLELEAMVHGVSAKMDLWETLEKMDVDAGAAFGSLIERGERQRATLKTHRHAALSQAFAGSPS